MCTPTINFPTLLFILLRFFVPNFPTLVPQFPHSPVPSPLRPSSLYTSSHPECFKIIMLRPQLQYHKFWSWRRLTTEHRARCTVYRYSVWYSISVISVVVCRCQKSQCDGWSYLRLPFISVRQRYSTKGYGKQAAPTPSCCRLLPCTILNLFSN